MQCIANMKYFIITIFLLCSLVMTAQTYYYDVTKTFYENGYTYQCDVLEGAKFVNLYNKDNKFVNVEQVDKKTDEQMSMDYNEQVLEDDSWTRVKCLSIINNAFSTEEKRHIKEKNRPISIALYIDSDTGKIADVIFSFISNTPFGTIPISVYRKMEKDLKENVWFIPTNEGKRWNYIALGWVHKVK